MSALVFLGGALVIVVLFSFLSWLRSRERSATFESSIDDFKHEMGVLAPNRDRGRRRKTR